MDSRFLGNDRERNGNDRGRWIPAFAGMTWRGVRITKEYK